MSINVKSAESGGESNYNNNDFNSIISSFGGSANIKSININEIKINNGDVVDGLQFNYNVVTMDGVSNDFKGNKYGGDGGSINYFTMSAGEQLLKISVKTQSFGKNDPTQNIQEFSFSAGVIYGGGIQYLTSIGAYVVTTVNSSASQPTTNSSASTSVNSNSPLVIALSNTTAILGLYFLITVGIFLWRKFHVSPDRESKNLGAETVNL
ncbi:hypothetical protein C1645_836458 [Glomus cerebriforme]|uniref:Jacalin-type lectin domain-containing protein n=1 Tax=Glomus cerebriforme TaxID=658196 RepID=A0A397SAJ8_9GLOM|nr:hypothetical protein C1645_836458 [Glomus cerebriforme]